MQNRPHSPVKQSILVASRLLATAAITAFIGAVLIGFYEKFFYPEAYDVGRSPFGAIRFYVFTIPFVLLALTILGLPASYLLRRLGFENWHTYSLVGAALGAVCLSALLQRVALFGLSVGAIYGSICAITWFALRRKF